ncbi:MAG: tRNA (adenosine(37)-N6)-dimethylallyltransferase MiaA [Chloroflexi bacterium]|nr:MAG: tRNA (adenosine(37)-N6)-dimethylallyltransferase MiaA [Chloroflexota bacterium]
MPPARRVVAIVGATASGKTAVAVAVAQHLDVEVVSADSRQVRAGMMVGTAAPTTEEQAAVRHHLVGHVPVDAPYTLADWLREARAALDDIWARGKTPLVVGGTGQYVWALLEGWQPPAVEPDLELRAELEAQLEAEGVAALFARLQVLAPEAADRLVDPKNHRRVIRAIEVAAAGAAPSIEPPDFASSVVGLDWPREALHERADMRVEAMYAAGLVEETRGLLERFDAGLPAMRTMGYAEAVRVASGEWGVDEAMARTKTETHRLIRMQATWFRRDDERIEWVLGSDLEAAVRAVETAALS